MQEIEFIKSGSLSSGELDALVSVLQLASARFGTRSLERRSGEGTTQKPPVDRTIASLESMGVRIYGLDGTQLNSANSEVSWDNIAGYDQQKRYVKVGFCDHLVFPAKCSPFHEASIILDQCWRTIFCG